MSQIPSMPTIKKFSPSDQWAEHFVKYGYIVLSNVLNENSVSEASAFLHSEYIRFKERYYDQSVDTHGWAIVIMDNFAQTALYRKIVEEPKLVTLLKELLGPDIALFNQDALWINAPRDVDPVLLKGLHNDAWTGTSVNTLFVKFFFTDCDEYNGVTVSPGSHLLGMVPVKNRSVDPNLGLSLETVNLGNLKRGDILIWHPLLIHSTTGHSSRHTRISMTSRYTSTETTFSSQERSLGYRTLSVGPMNQILRLIGNDYLTPFRTLGGYVGVDRRLRQLYGYSDFSSDNDYK
jgi:ectoine hydroxylase-related dioxygenase (phytanoyl-CoA dioxygenase family)